MYKVYGYQPAEAGELEFVIGDSYIPSGDVSYNFFGSELGREGLFAHSLELVNFSISVLKEILCLDLQDLYADLWSSPS